MNGRRGRTAAARRRRRGADRSAAWVQALILLLVFGAIIYVILGTGLGRKLRDKYAASLFDRLSGRTGAEPTAVPTSVPTSIPTAAPAAEPSPSPYGETAEVSLPAAEVYMLQMGVFSSADEASEKASGLKALGAAGYVYDDSGVFRLIAAAYSDEDSAQSVRSRLVSEGYECTVYRISLSGVDLVITAASERLLPVRTAFSLAYDAVRQTDELALEFDSRTRSVQYGLTVLSELRTNVRTASAAIEAPAEHSEVLGELRAYFDTLLFLLDDASSFSSDRTAFSSALKTLRIRASLEYASLTARIGG